MRNSIFEKKQKIEAQDRDILLVRKCLDGDAKAFKELYDHYKSWLYGICLRYCSAKDEAQDALQESMIHIYRNLNQFSQTASFQGWMKRITVNTCLAQFKKKNAQVHQYSREIQDFDADLDYSLIEKVDAEELNYLINRLSPGRRQVFNAYYIEGYSHKEIAEMLGISEGTSKSQLFDAKKELQKALENQLVITKKNTAL